MDRHDYEAASAFPMRKPNFGVFGIPQRTRSQRGWYQVQRHENLRPKQRTALPALLSSPTVLAAGGDLPMELVKLVGDIMSRKLSWYEDDDKHTMASCALVCRYWASQFLPQIFRYVFAHSRQRALELRELERSSGCWFHRLVEPMVGMEITKLSELSWLHLLGLAHYARMDLRLTGPLPRSWRTIRSIHQALPRSVPSSFSSGIKSLALTDIHFQSQDGALRYVGVG